MYSRFVALALLALAACHHDPVAPKAHTPHAATQRHRTAPALALAPASVTVQVGASAVVQSNYATLTYWGCEPYPACNAYARFLPNADNGDPSIVSGSAVTVTGLAPATFTLWATDSYDHDADGAMDFAYTTVTVVP